MNTMESNRKSAAFFVAFYSNKLFKWLLHCVGIMITFVELVLESHSVLFFALKSFKLWLQSSVYAVYQLLQSASELNHSDRKCVGFFTINHSFIQNQLHFWNAASLNFMWFKNGARHYWWSECDLFFLFFVH